MFTPSALQISETHQYSALSYAAFFVMRKKKKKFLFILFTACCRGEQTFRPLVPSKALKCKTSRRMMCLFNADRKTCRASVELIGELLRRLEQRKLQRV